MTTVISLTSILTLSFLTTSQAGHYSCAANMTIPNIVTDHQVITQAPVRVASEFLSSSPFSFCHFYDSLSPTYIHITHFTVPHATSISIQLSRNGSVLYIGTGVNLLCRVTVDTRLVDTPITPDFEVPNFVPDGNRTVLQSSMLGDMSTYQGRAEFRYLLPSDAGTYTCVTTFQPDSTTPFVVASLESSASLTLEVTGQ